MKVLLLFGFVLPIVAALPQEIAPWAISQEEISPENIVPDLPEHQYQERQSDTWITIADVPDKEFYFSTNTKEFDEAVQFCDYDGGKLFEPRDEGITQSVTTNMHTDGMETFWLGIHDKDNEEMFVYASDDSDIIWDNWGNGQPNDYGGQDCAVVKIKLEWADYLKWDDRDCSQQHSFVCIRDKRCLDIQQNSLVNNYANWDEYSIEFDILVTGLSTEMWLNVFRFTVPNKDDGQYGSRIPALFINKDGNFRFSTSLNDKWNYNVDFPFDLDKTYHVNVKQTKENNKYFFEIIIDGNSIRRIENNNPMIYENVYLYTSDGQFESFSSDFGFVCNVKIRQSDC